MQEAFEGSSGWFSAGDPVWFYAEYYYPHPIVGNGWLGTWGAAISNPNPPYDRLQTNPGLNFATAGGTDNGTFSGNNRVLFAWNSLRGVRSNFSAMAAIPPGSANYVGLPVGQWFEMEFMYVRSGWNVADGAMQLWIDGELVIDEQNVITYGTNFFDTGAPQTNYTNFEALWNWYGSPSDGSWNPQSPRHYTRNAQVATCSIPSPYSTVCISDGDAGDPTPPTGEGPCVPTVSCGDPGYECGTPLDDCGDPMDCSSPGCGLGESCVSYICVPDSTACDGFVADNQFNNSSGIPLSGFGPTQVKTTATGTLTADFYARATAANQDAHVGISQVTPIDHWDDHAMAIRFSPAGEIDVVRDATVWGCHNGTAPIACPTYAPNVWYHFVITADIPNETYSVQYAECDGALEYISVDRFMRTAARPVTSLGYWDLWASNSNYIQITADGVAGAPTGMDWTPGACTPTVSCGDPGYMCGAPTDDCGQPMDCSTPGCTPTVQTCYPVGTCCNLGTVATECTAHGYDCGTVSNLCGGTVSCGDIECGDGPGGDTCISNVCATPSSIFPLEVATSGNSTCATTGNCNRYLVDQNGDPFIIHGEAAWSGMGELSQAEMVTYIDNAVSKGFNTILVTAPETNYTNNSPKYENFNGDIPFTYSGGIHDLATASSHEAYWTYSDFFITYAESQGVAIILAPLYLGCCNDGLYASICDASNTTGDLTTYGTWVGQHYANQANIVAFAIGNEPAGTCYVTKMKAFGEALDAAFNANGLMKNRLGFFHPESSYTVDDVQTDLGFNLGEGSAAGHQWFDIRPLYRFSTTDGNPSSGPLAMADLARDEWQDSTPFVAPVLNFEPPYEDDGGGATTTDVRRYTYHTFLSGALAGQLYGTPHIWDFDSSSSYSKPPYWSDSSILNKPGRLQMAHFHALVASVDWWRLVPDFGATIVTSNRGSITTDSYVSVAKTTDNQTIVVYNSRGSGSKSITVNTTQLSSGVGGSHTWEVINPATGSTQSSPGTVSNSTGTVINPTANITDYVYVIRNVGVAPSLGDVTVTPNPTSAQCVLTGPSGYNSGTQTGIQTLTGLAYGTYTATFQDNLFSYTVPSPDVDTLSGPTLNMTGTYGVRSAGSLDVDIQLNGGAQGGDEPWRIVATAPFSSANFDSGNQTGDNGAPITANVYVGRSYTITYSAKPGGLYNLPSPSSEARVVAGAEMFTGNYTPVVGGMTFYATRTTCMAPCAIRFDAQQTEGLSWADVRDSEFIWDFDDGGSTSDSEGFMASTVYEASNPTDSISDTHTVRLWKDGVLWNTKVITVQDPLWIDCVSPSTSDFSDCPDANASHHHTSVSAAATASQGQARRWILLDRGRGSYGAMADNWTTCSLGTCETLIGAYSTGAKPQATSSGLRPKDYTAFADINLTACSGNSCFYDQFDGSDNNLYLRLDITASTEAFSQVYGSNNQFWFDTTADYGATSYITPSGGSEGLVIKRSRFNHQYENHHTLRIQGQPRTLIQDSAITGDNGWSSITIRGNATWVLVQGNYFDTWASVSQQNCIEGINELQQYVVWERNLLAWDSPAASGTGDAFMFRAQHMVVRNNVATQYTGGGYEINQNPGCTYGPDDVVVYNNVARPVNGGGTGLRCQNGACTAKNNIVYQSSGTSPCVTGFSPSTNNWCFAGSGCLDPVGGGSTCYDPGFLSSDPGSATPWPDTTKPWPASTDFFRPSGTGGGARGVGAGDDSVPVWNDYFDDARDDGDIDVGAVEQAPPPLTTRDLDAEGWTYFAEPPVNRTIYVDAVSGSNANDGLSPGAAKQTISGAWATSGFNNGQEWHVLLRRGQTHSYTGTWTLNKGGPDRTHPVMIGAYGGNPAVDNRPTVNFSGLSGNVFNVTADNVCVTDLILTGTGSNGFFTLATGASGILFEGVKWTSFSTTAHANDELQHLYSDIAMRRNAFIVSGNTGSSYYYNIGMDDMLMEENVWDFKHGTSDHHFYIKGMQDAVMRGNIFGRMGSSNNELLKIVADIDSGKTRNLLFENNAVLGGQEVQVGTFGNDEALPKAINETFRNNWFGLTGKGTDGAGLGRFTKALHHGANDGKTITGNLFVWGSSGYSESTYRVNQTQFLFQESGSFTHTLPNVVSGNVIVGYQANNEYEAVDNRPQSGTSFVFQNNAIEVNRWAIISSSSTGTYSNNKYSSPINRFFPGTNFSGWQSAMGDSGSTYSSSPLSFVEERTIEQYHHDVCGAGTGDYYQFIIDATDKHNKRDWNGGIWSGTNLSSWMRAGWTPQ